MSLWLSGMPSKVSADKKSHGKFQMGNPILLRKVIMLSHDFFII